MPTITIRLTASEKADLESAARSSRQSLSDYVRTTLTLREQQEDLQSRVLSLERRTELLDEIRPLLEQYRANV